jgi:penicillin-binding protein 1A
MSAGVRDALPTHAGDVAEMARQVVFEAYGDDAYTKGITVWTTVRRADQESAYIAVRRGVIEYDRRHGYRGRRLCQPPADPARSNRRWTQRSPTQPTATTSSAAVVLEANATEVKAVLANGDVVAVNGMGSNLPRAT